MRRLHDLQPVESKPCDDVSMLSRMPALLSRSFPLAHAATIAALLAATSCDTDGSGTCLDSWKRRSTGVAECAPAAACAQLVNQPKREVSFVISLAAHLDAKDPDGTFSSIADSERLANWTCMTNALRARGVKEIEPHTTSSDVFVTATWPQVEDLQKLELVTRIEAGCRTQGVCNHCESLGIEACARDAFCNAIQAAPVNAARMCVGAHVPVGCASAGRPCNDAISFAADPGGQCWQFGNGCSPRGWQADQCRPQAAGHYELCD